MTVALKTVSISFIFFAELFLNLNSFVESEEFCAIDDNTCSEKLNEAFNENKYEESDYYNQILSKINSSLNSYTDGGFKNCGCYLSVLKADLKPFRNGITKEMIDRVRSKGVTYVIYENRLYRGKECMFPSRCSGIEHFIKQFLPKLNNSELIINPRDWPQISRHFPLFGPVLSFSKTSDYLDIMYPAWSFWEGGPAIKIYPTGLGRWDLHRKSLSDESLKWPWDKKKSIGFFRGSRTSDKRDALVLLSRKRPNLIDAKYTKNQAWKSSQDTLGEEPAEVVTLEHHCRYKYLFNFRGVAASFRFKHLFLCGSLVIHVGNEWIEFYYPAIKPWVHYIPIEENASEEEMIKLISFLRSHDEIAREIAERGKNFVMNHLSFKEIKCYWKNLLNKYQKLLKYEVKLDKSLMEIR